MLTYTYTLGSLPKGKLDECSTKWMLFNKRMPRFTSWDRTLLTGNWHQISNLRTALALMRSNHSHFKQTSAMKFSKQRKYSAEGFCLTQLFSSTELCASPCTCPFKLSTISGQRQRCLIPATHGNGFTGCLFERSSLLTYSSPSRATSEVSVAESNPLLFSTLMKIWAFGHLLAL